MRRFDSHAELEAVADEFAPGGANAPIDGITLVQEYVQPAQPFITRAEFIGGRFHYAVRVDVSGGSFELCPADACTIPGAGADPEVEAVPQFDRREEITAGTPLIARLETLVADLGIEIAGVEFIETADGRQVVYDINTNTNYNPSVESAEKSAGSQPAADRIAEYVAYTLAEAATQSLSPAGSVAR
ncbi:MAG: hypothetical protein ACTIIH_14505 [Brevibacterium sp.]|uniref:hypothetical protein n=1 Tax=Brevibacterium sp. TaxID=1701 RepID=UPI003F93B583